MLCPVFGPPAAIVIMEVSTNVTILDLLSIFQVSGNQALRKELSGNKLAFAVVAVSVIAAFLNLITLVIAIRVRLLQKDVRAAHLLNVLAANISASATFAQLGLHLMGVSSHQTCIAAFYLNQWTYSTSWYSLMLQMVDQYVSIEFPLKYPQWVTRKKIYLGIFITWVLPVSTVFSFKYVVEGESVCTGIMDRKKFKLLFIYVILIFALVPLPTVTIVNLRIVWIARRRAKEVAVLMVSAAPAASNGTNLKEKLKKERQAFHQIWRSILTASVILLTMSVSIMPFTGILCWVIFNIPEGLAQIKTTYDHLSGAFCTLAFNCMMSPLIISLRTLEVKKFYATNWHSLIRKFKQKDNIS